MEIKISNQTIVRVLTITTIFIGILLLCLRVSQQLVWIGIAGFLALALEPAVDKLARFMPFKSRGLALGIVFSLFVGILAFLVINLTPPLVSQATQIAKDIPDNAINFVNSDNSIATYAREHLNARQLIGDQQQIVQRATTASEFLFSSVLAIISSLLATFTILIFTFFMILEGPKIIENFWHYQPESKKAHRKKLLTDMYASVTGYVNGTLLKSVIAGVLTIIALIILKIPYFLSLGILVGIFGIIPMVGGSIGAAIVVLLALLYGGTTKALILLVFFLIYSVIENNILVPIIFKKSVNISPLVTGIAAVLGVVAGGFVGALVAIPVAASLQILAKDYLETHVGN